MHKRAHEMEDILAGTLSVTELLLQTKALTPLTPETIAELSEIQSLQDLDDYSEADVREETITPIVRALGYKKGSTFSVGRERKLSILNKHLFVDYNVTLFSENFWLIEAKKPNRKQQAFKYDDLWQAVQYAIHPEVNAALVVLIDGHKIEVFDREASLAAPVLRVEQKHLVRDFDKLRALLSPWQAWFFQKRRVVRLIDKVFDREFNLQRVDEFLKLVDRRLDRKRTTILDNFRELSSAQRDVENDLALIRGTDTAGIVDALFFANLPERYTEVGVETLVTRCRANSFRVLHKVFPDGPRDVNDAYYLSAILFLIRLGDEQESVSWLPKWLSPNNPPHVVDDAVVNLIELCLTCLRGDEARKVTYLYSVAVRRILKAFLVTSPDLTRYTELRHALERHSGDELTFSQFVSSPERHALLMLDDMQFVAVKQFVRRFTDQNEAFKTHAAREELRGVWGLEKMVLGGVTDYAALQNERGLAEIHSSEAAGIVHDQLGHFSLCAIEKSPKWKSWTLEKHRGEIERLAALGSWQARKWLGLDEDGAVPSLPDQAIADRFFFGDIAVFQTLRQGYGWDSRMTGGGHE
jgi:hypothetical protein